MCGIAVAIDCDGAEFVVRRLIDGILHRGDVTDPLVTVGDRIAMRTRRLRIVDAAHGIQPLASFDERFLVSFNGEIYNHAELRRELQALGVRFRTECDTEVVANVLRVWVRPPSSASAACTLLSRSIRQPASFWPRAILSA